MTKINDLNTKDELQNSDKFVIWDGETRAITAQNAASYYQNQIAQNFQPSDATLTAISGLLMGPEEYIEATGVDTFRSRKLTVLTYAALTAIPTQSRHDDMLAYVASRSTDGDGGEGYWRFDAASSATANGGTILAPDAGSGRWIRQGISTIVDVLWFGVIPDGSTNNSVAVQAAVTYALTTGRSIVLFPPKVTKLTGDVITATLSGQSGIAFVGAGMGVTQILIDNASGNGFSIICADGNWWLNLNPSNSVAFRDMSIVTNKENLGTGIFIDGGSLEGRPGPPMMIQNVEIRGNDAFAECFAKGIDLLDVTYANLTNVLMFCGGPNNRVGIGFDIRSTDATTDPVQITFDHCKQTYGNIGWQIGEHVEGIYLTQCDSVAANRGLEWVSTRESGIHIVGGHMASYVRCIRLVGVADGNISGALLFKIGTEDNFVHIDISGGGALTIANNVMRAINSGTTEVGIFITDGSGGADGIMVSGNQFSSINNGILLSATASKVFIGENQFNAVTVPYNEGVAASAYISKQSWSTTLVVTLAGGSATENIDIALPPGQFVIKPGAGFGRSLTAAGPIFLDAYYDYDSGSTTVTNARFIVRNVSGATLSAGLYRFSIMLFQHPP